MPAAIRAEGLGKCYRLARGGQREKYQTLRESLVGAAAAPFRRRGGAPAPAWEEFWALRDVGFEVHPGEVVGVVGRNGAGKSTLLKILSRITKPTTGRVEINGRVGSLLEVGTGFHPELSGRENIYLNGSILGMSRSEIDQKFDEIVAFAEVEKFLDTPVKRYSSGMYVRLAFAVAAHLEPEILIVDEVLAVGDAAFQKKCMGKIGQVSRSGRTVMLVSHNMAAVTNLCSKAVLLESGRVTAVGTADEVVPRYLAVSRAGSAADADLSNRPRPAWAHPLIRWARFNAPGSAAPTVLALGGDAEITVGYDASAFHPIQSPVLGVVINHAVQGTVGGVNTRMTGFVAEGTGHTKGVLTCRLNRLPLLQGLYTVDVWLGDGATDVDVVEAAVTFEVEATDVYGTGAVPIASLGTIMLYADWTHSPGDGGWPGGTV
jgi:lipopolysaccharide transport system ATP-binding protein